MLSSAAGQASKRSKTIGPSSAGEQPISTAAPNTRIVSAPSVRSVWSTATERHGEQHPHLEPQRDAVVEAGRLRDHERDERERRVLEEELVVGDLAVEQLLRVALVQRHVAAAAVGREVHVRQRGGRYEQHEAHRAGEHVMSRGWGGVHAHSAAASRSKACPPGRRIEILVDTKLAASGPKPDEEREQRPGTDIRASRLYLFSRRPLIGALRRTFSVALLVAVDIVGLALGLYVALVLRTVLYGDTVYWSLLWRAGPREWLPFLIPVTVLVFLQAGLYARREHRAGVGRVVSSLILVALIILSVGLGTGYDFTTTGLIPTAVVTCSLAIGLLRAAYSSFALELMKAAGIRRKVVLVGEARSLEKLHRELGATRGGLGYEFLGAVSRSEVEDLPQLASSVAELPTILEQFSPDELILSEADFDERTVLDVVERAHRAGVKVRLAPSTTELLVQKGEYAPGQGVLLFDLRPPILTGSGWVAKRAFDLLGSALIVIIGLPFWLLIALAIKLDSRGPVFYVDRRIGVGEREFGMLKFRTMVVDAPKLQAELEEANEASGALFKIRDDPRVTRVGRVLRRFSIDELPQLVNALRGQMSLVGPRPLPLRDYELLEDWHRARYLVLPGHDRALADLGPLRPLVRRPRAARLRVPRELVDLARHLDHREDAACGPLRPRRVLTARRASPSRRPTRLRPGRCLDLHA